MKLPKEFEYYIKKGVVKKRTPDINRARDLIEEAERKLNSLNMNISKIGILDENANDIIEFCYDIIIYLIRAKMFNEGFYSSGKGAHESEVSFLRKLTFSDNEISFINQLRYFRNGVMYYGKRFDKEYAEKVFRFLNKILGKLI